MLSQIIGLGVWALIIMPSTCPIPAQIILGYYVRKDFCESDMRDYKKNYPNYVFTCTQIKDS